MPASAAATADDFLAALPADRRAAATKLRTLIRKHLPQGYEEAVVKGTLVYQVPLSQYPDTYNGQPSWYVALASQKSYLSLYLMGAYGDAGLRKRLEAGFKAAGKKLDMGKSCIHFKQADDLALPVIADLVAAVPMAKWIAMARAARQR